MRAQLESHLHDINRTADIYFQPGKPNEAIDLVVVTDAEAILGIGGESIFCGLDPTDDESLKSRPRSRRYNYLHL